MKVKVFDLTYIEYPDSNSGFLFAALSLLPLFLIFSLLPVSLVARKLSYVVLFVGVLCSTIVNESLKRLIREPRPPGSHREGFGMPSDHSQFCAFWTAYFIVYLVGKGGIRRSFKIGCTAVNMTLSLMVMYSRVFLGVHSSPQVLCGAVVGTIMGLGWGIMANKIFSGKGYLKVGELSWSYIDKLVYEESKYE